MPRDRLHQLLRTADASAPAPPRLSDDLTARVRRRLARRRQHWAAAAAVCITLIIGLMITMMLRRSQPPPPHVALHPATTTIAAPITTAPAVPMSDLALAAAVHELTAQKLLASSRRTSTSSASFAPSPASEAQFARDRAALILVYDADRHVKQNRPAAALAAYRRAAELFPGTHWGEVALRRLKEMQT